MLETPTHILELWYLEVVTSQQKKDWDVCFDVLPIDENIIENISWSKLSVLMPGDEENMESHQIQY